MSGALPIHDCKAQIPEGFIVFLGAKNEFKNNNK